MVYCITEEKHTDKLNIQNPKILFSGAVDGGA